MGYQRSKSFARTALFTAMAISPLMVSAQEGQLEEIIVTATKTAKSLQDVALSIEAVSGITLENYRIDGLKGLSDSIPNFTVSSGLTATNVSMRGLGSGQERGFEQAVGMFIDGQYMPRNRQYRSPFFDVERVEVVKGPQAVYFGLNSTAGAVSINTRKTRPGDGLQLRTAAEADLEFGGYVVDAAVGYGGERTGFRLAVKRDDTDGYFRNSFTGEDDIGGKESTLVRASMIFEATDNFTLSGKIEYSDYESDGNIGELFDDAAGREQLATIGESDGRLNYVRSSDGGNFGAATRAGFLPLSEPGQVAESTNLQLAGDLALGEGSLTATLGYSEFEYFLTVDLDTSFASILDSAIEEDYEQTSLDIRYQSDPSQNVNWMVGGYFHDTTFFNAQPNVWGQGFPWNGIIAGALGQPTADFLFPQQSLLVSGTLYDLDTEMSSVFGSVSFGLSDTVSMNIGARWVSEDKDLERGITCQFSDLNGGNVFEPASAPTLGALGACPSAALANISRDRSSDNFMPEVSVQWDATDNTMVFAKIGRSAKAGGFASSSSIDPNFLEFDDETVTGFEIGSKSRFMDGRAEFNATLFRSDFKDLQVNSFVVNPDTNLPQAVLENAAEAVSQGIELDGRFLVNESVTLGGSLAFLDAEYDDFSAAPCNRATTAAPDGSLPGTCNLTGSELPFAPEYSGNVYVDFNRAVSSNLTLVGGLRATFSDSYFTDGTLEEPGRQDSWTKVDARIGIANEAAGWDLSLVGTNLTDEAVLGTSQALLGYMLGYLEPPRGMALRFTWRTQ
ncbi:MAG: TonB-dependent receptor [Lysobacterales bacterium]